MVLSLSNWKTGTNVPWYRILTLWSAPYICVHRRLSKKHKYCSSLLLWSRVTRHLRILKWICRIRPVVIWTNSSMWLMIIRQHWKHVRKLIQQRLPSTRISRNTWLTLMRQLVKKLASARAISSLLCKDITEVCTHPTSIVSVRCIVLWFSQIRYHAKTWNL